MINELVKAIEEKVTEMLYEVHTAFPGKITGYSNKKGLAKVKPLVKYTTPNGKRLEYPEIFDLPVVLPQAHDIGMAYPIKEGDFCIVLVSEKALDAWITGQEDGTELRFDITSAMCIPGLVKSHLDIQTIANEKDAVVIGTKSNNITVSKSQIELNGDVKVNGSFYYDN